MPVAVETAAVAVRSTDGRMVHLPLRNVEPFEFERKSILPIVVMPSKVTTSSHSNNIVVDHDPNMWVQKYAPRGFNELLTPNKSNIEVLRWINSWKSEKLVDELPKILLISGPAGMGKTTLAHAAAKQDERTGTRVIERIKAAISADSIGGRSNLIILDEIDGAMAGNTGKESMRSLDSNLITFLVNAVSKPSSEGKKSKKTITCLNRPIICICNDPWTPALRPLRPHTLHLMIGTPEPLTLAQRLRRIGEMEGFHGIQQMDQRILLDLVDTMAGDIRACLMSLHWMSLTGDTSFNKGGDDLGSLLSLLWQSGDSMDRIVTGCHELYLSKVTGHNQVSRMQEVGEWLGFFEQMKSNASLESYQPLAAVKIGHLFPSKSQLHYPRADYQAHLEHVKLQSILDSYRGNHRDAVALILERIPATVQILQHSSSLIRSTNPLLMRPSDKLLLQQMINLMISEGLTFRMELGTEDAADNFNEDGGEDEDFGEEKSILKRQSSSNITAKYRLDPPIDDLLFATPTCKDNAGIRKMLMKEVEMENIRLKRGNHVKKTEAAMPAPLPTKKKEFFSRVTISRNGAESPVNPATDLTGDRIWFTFNDGSSNAVRRVCRISDLIKK